MLTALNLAQLVLYIALLALLGQGILYLLAGGGRQSNTFYQLFQVLNKPWVKAARFIAPKQIADHQVPFVAFFVLGVLYIAVTLAKVEHCVTIGVQLCKSA
jgi:cytochrome b561